MAKKKDITINKRKVAAVIRSFDNWIKEHTDYILPTTQKVKSKGNLVPYNRWYCGITKFENGERLEQHIKTKKIDGLFYKQLPLNNKIEANIVEAHFSELGTLNAPESRGAKEESKIAYLFKEKPNILEKLRLFLQD